MYFCSMAKIAEAWLAIGFSRERPTFLEGLIVMEEPERLCWPVLLFSGVDVSVLQGERAFIKPEYCIYVLIADIRVILWGQCW